MSRKKFITHPHYQVSFLSAYVKGILLSLVPVLLAFNGSLALLISSAELSDVQKDVLSMGFQRVFILSLLIIVIGVLAFGILGFILSNRYAGPVRRAEAWVDHALLADKASPLVMRNNDDLAGVMATLNRMVSRRRS